MLADLEAEELGLTVCDTATKQTPLTGMTRVLGVGPGEWNWRIITGAKKRAEPSSPSSSSAPVDFAQPDLSACLAAAGTVLTATLKEWLASYLDDPPRWASDLALAADPELTRPQADALARFLIRSCRSAVTRSALLPFRIERSSLFVLDACSCAYVPRLARELDFLLERDQQRAGWSTAEGGGLQRHVLAHLATAAEAAASELEPWPQRAPTAAFSGQALLDDDEGPHGHQHRAREREETTLIDHLCTRIGGFR